MRCTNSGLHQSSASAGTRAPIASRALASSDSRYSEGAIGINCKKINLAWFSSARDKAYGRVLSEVSEPSVGKRIVSSFQLVSLAGVTRGLKKLVLGSGGGEDLQSSLPPAPTARPPGHSCERHELEARDHSLPHRRLGGFPESSSVRLVSGRREPV